MRPHAPGTADRTRQAGHQLMRRSHLRHARQAEEVAARTLHDVLAQLQADRAAELGAAVVVASTFTSLGRPAALLEGRQVIAETAAERGLVSVDRQAVRLQQPAQLHLRQLGPVGCWTVRFLLLPRLASVPPRSLPARRPIPALRSLRPTS